MYTDPPTLGQLKAEPFADTVDPRFFFRTRMHERALNRMLHVIRGHRALGLVYGESGTGKTVISQQLLLEMRDTHFQPVLVLAYPGMSRMALLSQICGELALSPTGRYTSDWLQVLEGWVLEAHHDGRRLVIVVDEAHFLSSNALHLLRTISNLETPSEKLVTVLLFAESTIHRRLQHASYASLRGRICQEVLLEPLNREETEQYVKFRLLVAGRSPNTFEPEALETVHRLSRGIPREISKVADNALVEASCENRSTIDQALVLASVRKGYDA